MGTGGGCVMGDRGEVSLSVEAGQVGLRYHKLVVGSHGRQRQREGVPIPAAAVMTGEGGVSISRLAKDEW